MLLGDLLNKGFSGELKWEKIKNINGIGNSYRTKVFGGWLVTVGAFHVDSGGVGTTFIPDPNYEWKLNPIK